MLCAGLCCVPALAGAESWRVRAERPQGRGERTDRPGSTDSTRPSVPDRVTLGLGTGSNKPSGKSLGDVQGCQHLH